MCGRTAQVGLELNEFSLRGETLQEGYVSLGVIPYRIRRLYRLRWLGTVQEEGFIVIIRRFIMSGSLLVGEKKTVRHTKLYLYT